ncbi:putative crocetin glucosyltransferase [Helianthus annuus]|nr:putative crocetin glucosyltransferase [Helianthus annuus]KAJ0659347.1 putative crocetin glucosyltransferase [Helianthus annuus]
MKGHQKNKVLIIAYPTQGHINPSLCFATRLLKFGVNVTFCTSFYAIRRIDTQTTHHGLTLAPIFDRHHNGQQPTLQQFFSDFATNGVCAVDEIIRSATATSQPFDHLVYTTVVPWATQVAAAHSLESTLLWCQPATLLDIYYYYFNGYQDLISCNNNPTFPINLPGLPPITTSDQAEEMASGLLESGRPFLWVIREGDQLVKLSKIDELKKQGMIVSWCSQVEVLNHEAIGCFLTHCGWNSTIEALVAGVPTIAFAQWSDQVTNAKMIEDVWKTGVKVKRRERDGMVEGNEIKRCVEIVMQDREMRRNAEKWRELARKALNDGESSTLNLQAFLYDP